MVGEKKVADQILEEARNRPDPTAPFQVHPVRIATLLEAGAIIIEKNIPQTEKGSSMVTGFKSSVEYGDEKGSIIFYTETKRQINFEP